MSAPSAAFEPIDAGFFQAMMIRWKLAEQFLFDHPESKETGKMALHVLVCKDLPALIQEIVRLRPDLLEP
jgi:hypothetical protein